MISKHCIRFYRYRLKGQITAFTSLILVIVFSVIITAIKSAMLSVTLVNINSGANLALESVFAGYSKDLFNQYSLLFLSDSGQLQNELEKYMKNNTYSWNGYMKYSLQDIKIDKVVRATDQNGQIFKNQVVEYMKLGILPETISEFLNQHQQIEETKEVCEYVEKVEDCFELTNDIDKIGFQLLSLIEGVDTDESGFVMANERPVRNQKGFIKQLSIGEATPQNIQIENPLIYQTVSNDCIDIVERISDLRDKILQTDRSYDFKTEFYEIGKLVEQTHETIREASDIAGRYGEVSKQLQDKIERMEEGRIYNSYSKEDMDEINELKDYGRSEKGSICNINVIMDSLKKNELVIESAIPILHNITDLLDKKSDSNLVLSELNKFEEIIERFDVSKFVFHYSGLGLEQQTLGMGPITGVRNMMSDKFLSLVLEDKPFSHKVIEIKDLASYENNFREEKNSSRDLTSDLLYNEYIISKLHSYMDEEKEGQDESLLSYEMEYILNGNKEDKKNLEETLSKIWVMRQGLNLASLFKDSKLRNESYEMAKVFLGFTGNYALIKAGQFLVMNIWAMGESILDLKILCKNEKVPLFKSSQTWNLSLTDLMQQKFNVDSKKNKENTGLSYEDYIRILLNLNDSNKKYYLTMDIIELNMIKNGTPSFRFKNQIFSITATAQFQINLNHSIYSKKVSYQY